MTEHEKPHAICTEIFMGTKTALRCGWLIGSVTFAIIVSAVTWATSMSNSLTEIQTSKTYSNRDILQLQNQVTDVQISIREIEKKLDKIIITKGR